MSNISSRCTQTVLAAANAVIENNSTRKKKNMWTENISGKERERREMENPQLC